MIEKRRADPPGLQGKADYIVKDECLLKINEWAVTYVELI